MPEAPRPVKRRRPIRAPCVGGDDRLNVRPSRGEVPERSNGAVSKTVVGATLPWVRIPPSPPLLRNKFLFLLRNVGKEFYLSPSVSPNATGNGSEQGGIEKPAALSPCLTHPRACGLRGSVRSPASASPRPRRCARRASSLGSPGRVERRRGRRAYGRRPNRERRGRGRAARCAWTWQHNGARYALPSGYPLQASSQLRRLAHNTRACSPSRSFINSGNRSRTHIRHFESGHPIVSSTAIGENLLTIILKMMAFR